MIFTSYSLICILAGPGRVAGFYPKVVRKLVLAGRSRAAADVSMPDAKLNENAEPVAAPEPQADSDPRNAAQNPERDNAELRDKLLRALAELENLRRRTEKEVADAKLYGTSSLARDMLGFADNLHRAID
ncbi:MAG: nucleotide exchange factor GrpE, partial [Methylovirgula sp.]